MTKLATHLAIDPAILDMLRASRVAWRVEDGTRHYKLFVAGRFVCALPHGRRSEIMANGRAVMNARSTVKRAIREAQSAALAAATGTHVLGGQP